MVVSFAQKWRSQSRSNDVLRDDETAGEEIARSQHDDDDVKWACMWGDFGFDP